MIVELKTEVEKTLGRRIATRGDCELLAEDLYMKTGQVISYNTFRRFFGIIEYRKPRETTLDALAVYLGFESYQDFTKRFTEVDTWPMWEHLYVMLSEGDSQEILKYLHLRKQQQDHFSVVFTIVVRELLNRRDLSSILLIFRDPMFQFSAIPYDQVAQIGVIIGLHFRTFDAPEIEEVLLLEPNFRDLVFKIFVDYGRLNSKYGEWIDFLTQVKGLDEETRVFLNCLQIWRKLINQIPIEPKELRQLPELDQAQHPILFGRLYGLKILCAKQQKEKNHLNELMETRLMNQPNYVTELLYEPAVQALVLDIDTHEQILLDNKTKINQIRNWYHLSQVAIHRVYQVKMHIQMGYYIKAKNILDGIPYGHMRHGYREFIELYVAFFRWYIAKSLNEPSVELEHEFNLRKTKLNYPIFGGAYFERYFDEN